MLQPCLETQPDTLFAKIARRRLYRGLIWYPFALALWGYLFYFPLKGQGLLMMAVQATLLGAFSAHIMYCQFHTDDQREQALEIRYLWYSLMAVWGAFIAFAWGCYALYVIASMG